MKLIRQGFIYYLLATILGGLLLLFYIQGDSVASTLDKVGWLFFLTSCFSHAAILMLALWLIFFLPWALLSYAIGDSNQSADDDRLHQYAGVQDIPLSPERLHP